ncbi:hypothetical protein BDZ94DRAFT_1205400 [Collybia nuda]|uniref:DUF6534 domain-containing protein n=1 Tax=Collybia nuda TaxID=64659 RepID=A0A9P5XQP9_9AGAR|nr:hypothetical protein BDZ94DRAFT_1205400 [Collybia nuda]
MSNVSSIIDGFFFGYIVTLVLFGVIIVQFWIYFHDNNDGWRLRTYVATLFLLDVADTVCTTQLIHYYLISNFGDVNVLKSHTNLMSINFTIIDTTYFLVHLFFVRRLWKLTKSWYIPFVITLTSTTMLALAISILLEQNLAHLTSNNYERQYIMIELGMLHGLAIISDVLITVGLSWTFSRAPTRFKATRTVIQQLLIFSVTRGIVICLAQVGHIVMYFLNPANMLSWVSLHLALGKLYVLTTLVRLNSRNSLREKLGEVNMDAFPISFQHSTRSHASSAIGVTSTSDATGSKVPGTKKEPSSPAFMA